MVDRNSFTFNSRKLPYVVMWSLLFFVAIEIATRLLWSPTVIGERLYGSFLPDYNYGYDFGSQLVTSRDNKLVFYRTQYCGIREQYLEIDKREKECRIFVFGNAATRGLKNNNFPAFLEDLINSSISEKICTVTNFSAFGYGSTRLLLMLEKVIPHRPDLVILDIDGRDEYTDELYHDCRDRLYTGLNKLLFMSRFIVVSKKIYADKIGSNNSGPGNNPTVSDFEKAVKNIANRKKWNYVIDGNFSEMVEIAVRHKISVLIMGSAQKNKNNRYENKWMASINQVKEKYSLADDVFYFDTAETISGDLSIKDKGSLFEHGASCFTKQGHKVIAKGLAEYILIHILKPSIKPG